MKFKVVNLNIWLGGILFDEIVQFLDKEDADIVTLQEVYDQGNGILLNYRI